MKPTQIGDITVVSKINGRDATITIKNIYVVLDPDSNLLSVDWKRSGSPYFSKTEKESQEKVKL